ncbi:MAG: hypothetical protein N2747_06340 [Chitinophagaceae bacterium]|nr:hypothetical protein [Chitinophagaceae bacterium]
MPSFIKTVVEDWLQSEALNKLIKVYRNDLIPEFPLGLKGIDYIRKKIKSFNDASQFVPHIIIADLDTYKCPKQLISEWIRFNFYENCLFQIAVKEVEAWLLADTISFSNFFGINPKEIKNPTDEIDDPKQFIIKLAKKSKRKKVKDIIPFGSGKQGPGYNSILSDFIINKWSPEAASENNRSLHRAIQKLKAFCLKNI